MRQAKVYFHKIFAGVIAETEDGYSFEYDKDFLRSGDPHPISKTLPLTSTMYRSNVLFPFFDGLIPEGWLLDIAEKNWKLKSRDRFGLLLACCRNCIGAVSVVAFDKG
jgi:serine/threonine-protein kinase HipA